MRVTILTLACMTFSATAALSQDIGDTAVGFGVTTFGLAAQGEYTMQPGLTLRGMLMGGISVSDQFEDGDYTVDGTADLGGVAVLADYYPLGNAWRISGGLLLSNSELTGDFTGPETFTGTVAMKNDIAPVLTTGFKVAVAPGWAVSGDLGVVVSSLEVTTDSTDPAVQSEVDELNADLEDIPVLPYLGVAVSYSF